MVDRQILERKTGRPSSTGWTLEVQGSEPYTDTLSNSYQSKIYCQYGSDLFIGSHAAPRDIGR